MNIEFTAKYGDKIKSLMQGYGEELANIEARRNQWINRTRDEIYKTLGNIKNLAKIEDLVTQKVVGDNNSEAVNIGFPDRHSGIVYRIGGEISVAVKYGGYLSFSQIYNGKIVVFIEYPYVEKYVGKTEHKLLSVHEPSDFTEDLVFSYFENFIKEMILWESRDINPIGFKINNLDQLT